MAVRAKKKTAASARARSNGHVPSETKKVLRGAIRDEREIEKLAVQLQRVALRADGKLADARVFLTDREAKLSGPAAGH